VISEVIWVEAIYIVAAVLFLLGIKRLGSPATARSGIIMAAIGALLAIGSTFFYAGNLNYVVIVLALAIGSLIGAVWAYKVPMTAMPQTVALFNGFGGGASALIAIAEYLRVRMAGLPFDPYSALSIGFGGAVGALTFSGSVIAFAKLQELMDGRPAVYKYQNETNMIMMAATVILWIAMAFYPSPWVFTLVMLLPFIVGVTGVIRIGGADMPVVISLLNSFSGVAMAGAGFIIHNSILIVAGATVGASGLILTEIMARAMNRTLGNILFSAFGSEVAAVGQAQEKAVRSVTPEEAAMVLAYAQSVIVVPGYGLAVAQAQHDLAELGALLEKRGISVKYAIHPVAGRMPGHMNVLLAEANVPYDKLYDLDEINHEFERTDVVIVIGANDVVNPDARTNPDSPLYGMPILDADKAKSVLVLKRSMNPGFSGVDNPLFYLEKTMMLFGDAKKSVVALVNEIKNL